MLPTPALPALAEDALWCLGLGLLLAAVRDLCGLVLGNGRLLCAVWDVLAFSAAAFLVCGFAAGVSATGTVRWYMLMAMAAGALGWRAAISDALHCLVHGLLRLLSAPLRQISHHLLRPMRERLLIAMKSRIALHRECEKKREKKPKTAKKQLQNQRRILYN